MYVYIYTYINTITTCTTVVVATLTESKYFILIPKTCRTVTSLLTRTPIYIGNAEQIFRMVLVYGVYTSSAKVFGFALGFLVLAK